MDRRSASQKLEDGSFLVLLESPEGLDVGLDCNHQHVLTKFRGFKMVPPGVHFLHYGWGGKGGDSGQRKGLLFEGFKGQVLVLVWDSELAEFVLGSRRREALPEGAEEELVRAVKDRRMDAQLAAYSSLGPSVRRWSNLVNTLSPEVFQSAGVELLTTLVPDEDVNDGIDWDAAKAAAEMEAEGRARSKEEAVVPVDTGFVPETPVGRIIRARRKRQRPREVQAAGEAEAGEERPARTWIDVDDLWMGKDLEHISGLSAADLTRCLMDIGERVIEVVERDVGKQRAADGWRLLLGQWQLSFILAFWLLDGPALRQWQHLSQILMTSPTLVRERPQIAVTAARMTVGQLHFVPDELLEDYRENIDKHLVERSFYVEALEGFLQNLIANSDPPANPVPIQEAGMKLHGALERRTERTWAIPSNFGTLLDANGIEEALRLQEYNEDGPTLVLPEELTPILQYRP
uniref:AAR2 splicing factor homolog n=1 Tax=Pinguiococcus pyrenoidosus TaxID=172671 RepID=A0A7R9U7N6_9STRA|mmetsp:Transcript_17432/g.66394  ORF Transcript_17432/g.66394 Transcript_17432/m.66394 type:complete len:461 (+) Transcript_17432:103-1485(+)